LSEVAQPCSGIAIGGPIVAHESVRALRAANKTGVQKSLDMFNLVALQKSRPSGCLFWVTNG
jgi:hypothetical protein